MRKVVPGLLICGLTVGCTSLQPLDTTLFVPKDIRGNSMLPIDASDRATVAADVQSGPQNGDQPKNASVLPRPDARPFETLQPLDDGSSVPATQPTVMDAAVLSPAPVQEPSPVENPTTAPVATGVPQGQGVYMTVGAVLAQVNNTPIYSSQVLTPLSKELAAKSRELDVTSFRQYAEQEIGRQLVELIESEEYFANDFHALTAEDRQQAEMVVASIRLKKITAAGGSESLARQKSLDEGVEFDEALKQEYRKVVGELFRFRHVEPLVQVTADEMRAFYRINVAKLYSQKDKAQFRVLMIDPLVSGGARAAMDKITALRERAVKGADFSKLASTQNDDDYLKARAGNPSDEGAWIERNTYVNDAVEAALWNIQPGEITPVIESDHKFYIARLDARVVGVTRPFDDQQVQDDIYARLRQQRVGTLMRRMQDDSMEGASIVADENRMQTAVDMAMQKYGH